VLGSAARCAALCCIVLQVAIALHMTAPDALGFDGHE
jgi:hypothetical protein